MTSITIKNIKRKIKRRKVTHKFYLMVIFYFYMHRDLHRKMKAQQGS